MKNQNNYKESTKAVHAGESREKAHQALIDPIVQTSNFTFPNSGAVRDFMAQRKAGENEGQAEYGRYGNPTTLAVEHRLAALEETEDALLLSSGMAAITTCLLTFLEAGDHIILTDDCYRRTREFASEMLKKFGVSATLVPLNDFKALEAAIQPKTKVFFSETPTNPYLRILDLPKWVDAAKKVGAITILDATFATPINLRPSRLGIDLVIHSATKYLGGHNDLLAGSVAGAQLLVQAVRETVFTTGAILDPHSSFLLGRGLKTLALRVEHQNECALRVAEFLMEHPRVEGVWYPGLATHPDFAIATELLDGFGGVVSFTIQGGFDETAGFIDRLKIPFITPSLGGVECLVTQPAMMSYSSYSPEERQAIGVKDNLVRYAVGIENAEDLIADLAQALNA